MATDIYAADKAKEASDNQVKGQQKAAQLAYQAYQQQAAGMQPWVQSGNANLARLNYALYGQMPTADMMALNPDSLEYQQFVAQNPDVVNPPLYRNPATGEVTTTAGPGYERLRPAQDAYKQFQKANPRLFNQPLYRNPVTGEISTTAPTLDAGQMGVQGGGINPSDRFTTEDWQSSPEYAAYANARDATLDRTSADLAAQAGASGMYGSGNVANALAKNVGQIYATYDPASLAAARDAWTQGRTLELNQLAALANPSGVQQTNTYAQNYANAAGNAAIGAGNALAQGAMNQANIFSNGVNTALQNVQGVTNAIRSNQPTGASTGGSSGWNTGGTDYGGGYWRNVTSSVDAYGGGDYY